MITCNLFQFGSMSFTIKQSNQNPILAIRCVIKKRYFG
ncbi:hypothetical protein HPSA50_1677 [Helicobacter pylori SouthAfrica50]|uniref:Uncharacterized protein n=1 Tax=Helicobacter pylori SouthAfrica50 TaxID=1352357 RepID=T2S9G4_HELPX|nr:hypothetical protein HPSA50_1677 [Helicobacter pylori SouthAfrica50]